MWVEKTNAQRRRTGPTASTMKAERLPTRLMATARPSKCQMRRDFCIFDITKAPCVFPLVLSAAARREKPTGGVADRDGNGVLRTSAAAEED